MRNEIGKDLSPTAMIRDMLQDERQKKFLVAFCENVMTEKETEKKNKERTNSAILSWKRRRAATGRRVRENILHNISREERRK